MYEVATVSSGHWIHIVTKDSCYEPDAFVEFVKAYQAQVVGKVVAAHEDMQYMITGDPLGLIFQWDSCLGIVVIVPHKTKRSTVENRMEELCNTLNAKLDR